MWRFGCLLPGLPDMLLRMLWACVIRTVIGLVVLSQLSSSVRCGFPGVNNCLACLFFSVIVNYFDVKYFLSVLYFLIYSTILVIESVSSSHLLGVCEMLQCGLVSPLPFAELVGFSFPHQPGKALWIILYTIHGFWTLSCHDIALV